MVGAEASNNRIDMVGERLLGLSTPLRALVFLLAAIAVGGAYTYFMYLPAKAELATLQSEENDVRRRLHQARAIVADLDKFRQEVALLDSKLEQALQRLPNEEQLYVLLNDIDALGKNAGLEFKAFRRQSKVDREFYAEVPIEIELDGAFHDVVSFFDEISRLDRIVNVSELQVSIGSEGVEGTELQVKGRALTYQFIDQSALASEEGAG